MNKKIYLTNNEVKQLNKKEQKENVEAIIKTADLVGSVLGSLILFGLSMTYLCSHVEDNPILSIILFIVSLALLCGFIMFHVFGKHSPLYRKDW